ncbi:phosphohistidine phosphatase [Candidatus Methylacidiphilum fumarolicum]|uniref:Phosphohistidine phosphatase SixA n=2 Tax=Candidatus Methylacidiphilum fumarolicum TaxID=591154 RepID=I0JXX2_METFB|nr:histidine phosphatase family protein [Candidatus Methylacidiphilum fumarolicum]MBW6414168.1 histidine phosphatase family protein [Candidatus Methylacidiphilum fumarolicum]TFE69996.1 phosphohistidine phosphatase [Candidatus Methylacidiphilum fumarolicum]TFE73801.1 phosphohistidine phosphatase [Candidatus Methylacidiphilum fumarolicum]TFE75593.1 phosphohistidine phosphatase [Candidatus Methylacidiphilum fumarolicum]TFE76758.1 phosphohistidine phosphatase [Candidatus Methylacidiphilum fumaroli
MELVLIQNAEAIPKELDPDRPLAARGREVALQVGKFLKFAGISPKKIFHSPKDRSRQTAEIVAKALSRQIKLQLLKGLLPGDSISDLLKEIKKIEEDSIIVGHEPTLSKLAVRLLVKSKVSPFFQMEPASCLWLYYNEEEKGWYLKGFIRSQSLFAPEKRLNSKNKISQNPLSLDIQSI